jgi:phage FluMu protein Com
MQINCSHCHRPYAISKDEVHAALDQLDTEHQGHYNTSCPHCRRVNRVSFSQLQHAAPDWTSHAQEEKVNE